MLLVLALLTVSLLGRVGANLCQVSYCTCQESEVDCTGTGSETLELSSSSLPKPLKNIYLRKLGGLTVGGDSLTKQTNLNNLHIENIDYVKLEEKIFGDEEQDSFLTSFTLSNLQLDVGPKTFLNSPRCSEFVISGVKIKSVPSYGLKLSVDTFTLENSNIGKLEKESIYSDALNFNFINNTIGILSERAFDASIRWFNFSLNDIGKMEDRSISVGFLSGVISRNIFRDMEGSPLTEIGPDPVCMPDPDSDPYADYSEVKYNVVANPKLQFTQNTFIKFNISFLEFPGAKNVPLGSLSLSQNRVPCNCEDLKELAILADFEHVVPQPDTWQYGDILFRKEFYDSAICDQENGTNMSLKKFARAWLEVTGNALACVAPKKIKQRRHDNSTVANDTGRVDLTAGGNAAAASGKTPAVNNKAPAAGSKADTSNTDKYEKGQSDESHSDKSQRRRLPIDSSSSATLSSGCTWPVSVAVSCLLLINN